MGQIEKKTTMITEEELIDMIVEYLCEDHSEQELRELVDHAVRLSNGGPDIEKVIKGLECHAMASKRKQCTYVLTDCPYVENCKGEHSEKLHEDAISIIKKQHQLIDDITRRRMNDGAFD